MCEVCVTQWRVWFHLDEFSMPKERLNSWMTPMNVSHHGGGKSQAKGSQETVNNLTKSLTVKLHHSLT